MNWEEKEEKDLKFFMNSINNHANKNDIIAMFMKGPPKDDGFMFCSNEGDENCYWTKAESDALKYIGNLVLDKDWDSSGYGLMMRKIQRQIHIQQLRKSPPLFDNNNNNPEDLSHLPTVYAVPVYDDRKNLEVEAGKVMAKEYQKTTIGKSMDENNKNALEVAANKGWDEAAKHMMEQAGGDYSKMRSMFG